MLEGTTCIELTNVKTGEKEKYEYKNMVTNAIRDIMKNPMYINRTTMKSLMPFYKNLFGGLVCFDTALEEDADNYFLPFEVDTIASGSVDYKNTTDDLVRGSYSSAESEINEEEGYVKFVYDFSTLQGNGNIKSICLTHKNIGQYLGFGIFNDEKIKNKYIKDSIYNNNNGIGYHSDDEAIIQDPNYFITGVINDAIGLDDADADVSLNRALLIYTDTQEGSGYISNLFNINFEEDKGTFLIKTCDREKDSHGDNIGFIYSFKLYNLPLNFKKLPSIFTPKYHSRYKKINQLDIRGLDFFNSLPNELQENLADETIRSLTTDGNNIQDGYRVLTTFYDEKTNKIHLLLWRINGKTAILKSGESGYYLFHYTLDFDNNQINFINYTYFDKSYWIDVSYYNSEFHRMKKLIDDIYIFFTRGKILYRLNIEDLTIESFYTFDNNITIMGYYDNCILLKSVNRPTYDNTSSSSFNYLIYFNYKTKQYKVSLLTVPDRYEQESLIFIDEIKPFIFISRDNNSSNQHYYIQNKLGIRKDYLATINNLPEPIEKTEEKTMKITYTLREV